MPADFQVDEGVPRIAAAIGDPGRARMLYVLMDGHARTATELAIVAGVSASTASVHLTRLREEKLVKVVRQGKHRYFTLYGVEVAAVLEGLVVLSGGPRNRFIPNTPNRLRMARTCYDHMAGTLGVSLHDCMVKSQWLVRDPNSDDDGYTLTSKGEKEFLRLRIDMKGLRATRRRFASQCIDWSERRPHLGGAVGAAIFTLALKRKWVSRDLDSRILSVTPKGVREIRECFGADLSMVVA
jgi:DNA-binding transcriptional ArsR family regulator